jgi:hypothetical protein
MEQRKQQLSSGNCKRSLRLKLASRKRRRRPLALLWRLLSSLLFSLTATTRQKMVSSLHKRILRQKQLLRRHRNSRFHLLPSSQILLLGNRCYRLRA